MAIVNGYENGLHPQRDSFKTRIGRINIFSLAASNLSLTEHHAANTSTLGKKNLPVLAVHGTATSSGGASSGGSSGGSTSHGGTVTVRTRFTQ